MKALEGRKIYDAKEIKRIVLELMSLGCPVWKIAQLLNITEQKVVQYSGVDRRDI